MLMMRGHVSRREDSIMKEWENCENCKRRVIFTSISDEDMYEHEHPFNCCHFNINSTLLLK